MISDKDFDEIEKTIKIARRTFSVIIVGVTIALIALGISIINYCI